MDKYSEFVSEVKKMRKLQAMYFKSRNYSDLADAKKQEHVVDRLIVEFENPSIFNTEK